MTTHWRLDDVGQSEELARRVTRCSAISLAIAAAALSAVYASKTNHTLQGWVAAAGAALVFGGSSLPAKHPAAVAAGTLEFQLWVTVGNAGLNILLLLMLHVPVRWSPWGAAGAAILTGTQLLAWPAIQVLGAAVGPGVWCGIGMITAFLWGVIVFGEALRSAWLAGAALLGLVSGVAGVAASQLIDTRRAAAPAPALLLESPSLREGDALAGRPAARPWRAMATGLVCAVGTGLLDGSLMAPFSAFERRQQRQQGQQGHPRAHAGKRAEDGMALRYVGGFALGLLCVALPPLLLGFAAGWRRRRVLSPPCVGAGVAAGALWAAGNVLSVHATMRLGQAVGFPLTQVCVVVSALWGILYFGELRERTALRTFAASAVLMLAAAAALKLAGADVEH